MNYEKIDGTAYTAGELNKTFLKLGSATAKYVIKNDTALDRIYCGIDDSAVMPMTCQHWVRIRSSESPICATLP